MPSPNPAGLIKLQNISVNHYNGVASASVPIYTMDVGGNQIPIILQYNTGGGKGLIEIDLYEVYAERGTSYKLAPAGDKEI